MHCCAYHKKIGYEKPGAIKPIIGNHAKYANTVW